MIPLLPIEALCVPIQTGQVMGIYTSPIPAVSMQSAALSAFPEIWKLGSAQYDGWPLPVGIKSVAPQVLEQRVRALTSSPPVALTYAANYTAGPEAWYRRTGDYWGIYKDASTSDIAGIPVRYLYFASKMKRHVVSRAYHGHRSYTVSRVFTGAQPRDYWRLNLFDSSTQSAANAAGGWFSYALSTASTPALVSTKAPGEDGGATYTLTTHPLMTAGPTVLGTQTIATLGASPQDWLRMSQLEVVVNGNTVDVTGQINALFPGSGGLEQAQRAYAQKFAVPLDWPNQKRDFDTAVHRQGEIPALNCVPIPSFETNVPGLVFDGQLRDAFQQHGDFVCMAWKPHETDESSVWVLNRIRIPAPIPMPSLTPQSMGLPSWFQGAKLWPSAGSTAPIISNDPGQLLGMAPQGSKGTLINGWNPLFNTTASFAPAYRTNTNVTQFGHSQQIRALLGGPDRFEPFGATEPPLASACKIEEWPCIGFSVADAMARTPADLLFVGQLDKIATEGTHGWTVRVLKMENSGVYETHSTSVSGTNPTTNAEIQAELDANTIAAWANGFYLNAAKFGVVGNYYWRDSAGNFIHEQPIYGHKDLVQDLTITIQFNSS